MAQPNRSSLHITELPVLALNRLVQLLDPGGRLSLRETCTKLKEITDGCGHPTMYLGSDASLQVKVRFMLLSSLSEGVQELDVVSCNADLHSDAAEALQQYTASRSTAWQSLRQLRCHYQQMVLVKALVGCSPKQLSTIKISGRRGNWQHAGLLLQQLVELPSLGHLELALPAQHKLEDYLAQLTQLKSLKLTQAPRNHTPWPLAPLGQSNQAKVDADFWSDVICALTQLTSLELRLPLSGFGHLCMTPLKRLQRLHVCMGKDSISDFMDDVTALSMLTSLSIDGKVGRRLTYSQHQAMMQQHQMPDMQPLGQLTALRKLHLNLHTIQDLASLVPLTACKQLTQLACSKLLLQLPWRAADLTPSSVAAADAAEERLVAGVLAGQRNMEVPAVLFAKAAAARAAPVSLEGISSITFPLLPQLQQLRVMTLGGKLPLAILAPSISTLSLQGKKRVWSYRKGSGDDMDALFAGMQLVQAEGAPQGPAAGAGPAAQAAAAAVAAAMGQAGAAAPAGGGGGGAAGGAGQHFPAAAAAAGANAAPQAAVAAGQQQQQAGAANPPAAAPLPPPPPPGLMPLHGGPMASRARAAVAQAERLQGLVAMRNLDVSFTQMCGICAAAGGRALLENIVNLTVLMRGAGRVRGGVPLMPNLTRLELYDDTDLKLPGRLSIGYDQKEDHQLWINQKSVVELVLSGSFILGGFFDGAALLKARACFPNLKRWVFKDCLDLSIAHLAALMSIRVAPTIVLEGSTVLWPSEVRTLIALNPNLAVDLVWSAHVPPNYGLAPHRDRYYGPGYAGWLEDEFLAVGPVDLLEPPDLEPVGGGMGGLQGGAAAAAGGGNAGAAAAPAGAGGNAAAAAGGAGGGNAVNNNAGPGGGAMLMWPPWFEDFPMPGGGGGGNGGGNAAANQAAAAAAGAAAAGGDGQQQQQQQGLAAGGIMAGALAQLQPILDQAVNQINQAVQAVNQAVAAGAAGGQGGAAAAAAIGVPAVNLPAAQVGNMNAMLNAFNVLQNQWQQMQQQQQPQQGQAFGGGGGGNQQGNAPHFDLAGVMAAVADQAMIAFMQQQQGQQQQGQQQQQPAQGMAAAAAAGGGGQMGNQNPNAGGGGAGQELQPFGGFFDPVFDEDDEDPDDEELLDDEDEAMGMWFA